MPTNSAASPINQLTLALPSASHFLGPINPEWPNGKPHGKQWRHTVYPDLCICDYLKMRNTGFNLENDRNAVLAENRIFQCYGTMAKSFYALQDHMVKSTEPLRKNGPVLRPGDFFTDKYFQMDVSQGAVPSFRVPTPTHPIDSGLPYNDDEVPEILPKFWKDVDGGGGIFLIERDLLNPEDLYIPCPTATAEKKNPDRTISNDRRILWDGSRVNLYTPKCDYYRPGYVKIEDIVQEISRLSRSYHGVDILINNLDIKSAFKPVRIHPDGVEIPPR